MATLTFGELMKKRREEAKVTPSQLAVSLGYQHTAFIYQVEKGYKIPASAIKIIADVLGLKGPARREFYFTALKEHYPDLLRLARYVYRTNGAVKVKKRQKKKPTRKFVVRIK